MITHNGFEINPLKVEAVTITKNERKKGDHLTTVIMESGRKYSVNYKTHKEAQDQKLYLSKIIDSYINPVNQ